MSSFSLCIERLPNCYSVRTPFPSLCVSPDWAFTVHISRALPTEMIFYLLHSITSKFFTRTSDDSIKKLHMLEIIIKWLQVSVSECNGQTSRTINLICVY